MHFAVLKDVLVKLCAHISYDDLTGGQVHEDTFVASAKFSVDSSQARYGRLGEPQSSDEITIREVIGKSVNGFNAVNQSVENIRLSYLAKYPINKVDYLGDKQGGIRKIKEAIECIIPRVNLRNDLKTYDQYLQSEKLNDDEDKNFKAWLTYIQDKLILTK